MAESTEKISLLVICGPTAAGKTALALSVAESFPLEVVSADSRQVYRGMDIGTAKATAEEQDRVPHHLLDLIDPDQSFSAAAFVARAVPVIRDIVRRGRLPCVVGGTGLYIQALLGGLARVPGADPQLRAQLHQRAAEQGTDVLYRELEQVDPQSAARIHPHNLVRLVRALEVYRQTGRPFSAFREEHGFSGRRYEVLKIAPGLSREALYQRINHRSARMLQDGLISETESLLQRFPQGPKALQTLGYREVGRYLRGELSPDEMLSEIRKNTRRYAKRQLTWFRREDDIIWVDSTRDSGKVVQSIDNFIHRKRSGHA